jgi:hypothetical protein
MTLAQRVRDAATTLSATEQIAVYEHATQMLDLMAKLIKAGSLHTAAAVNIDAGNIIAVAVGLARKTNGPPDGLTLPSPDDVKMLIRLPADAASHLKAVAHWVDLNLSDAPLTDRLAAVRTLRLLDPTNRVWTSDHNELEECVVRLWQDETDQRIAAGDQKGIITLNDQIATMGFLGRSGQHLLHKLEAARITQLAAAAEEELAPLGTELHMAWAAMDLPRAKKAEQAWRDSSDRSSGDHIADVQAVFGWIRDEQHRMAKDRASQDRIADLIRALDELEPVQAIERRYAAIRTDGIHVPAAAEARVSHRIQEERRRRSRAFAVALVAIIAVASVVTTIVIVRQQSADRTAMIARLSMCIEDNLRNDLLAEARDCWSQAVAADLIGTPRLAAHSDAIERAEAVLQARAEAAALDVQAAAALLTDETATLQTVENANQLLKNAMPFATIATESKIRQLQRRSSEIYAHRIDEARDERALEFASIEELLATDTPSRFDRDGWDTQQKQLRRAKHMLIQLREQPAADEVDLLEHANRLERRIAQLEETAQTRADAIKDADQLIAKLATIPLSECNRLQVWDDLLDRHAALLTEGSSRNWSDGHAHAKAACAVQQWRETVYPILNRSGLMPGATGRSDPGRAKTSLQAHIDQYGDHTPYRGVANQLIVMADGLSEQSLSTSVRQAIEKTGLLDLHVANTEDGYRYLRPRPGGWSRVDSRQDLTVDPNMLKPLTGTESLDLYSNPKPAAIASALQEGLAKFESDSVPTMAGACDLLQAIDSSSEADQLLMLATYRQIWDILLASNIPIPPETRTQAEDWLNVLAAAAPAAARSDWPRLAHTAASSEQHTARRQALNALTRRPGQANIRLVSAIQADETARLARPRVLRGLFVPKSDVPTFIARLLESEVLNPEILMQRTSGWHFFQVTDALAHDEEAVIPQGVPRLPVLLFGAP